MKPNNNFDKPTIKGRHVQTTTAFESLPNQKSAVVAIQDFDFDEIERNEGSPEPSDETIAGVKSDLLGSVFSRIVQWIYKPEGTKWVLPEGCKARLYVFLWISKPQLFDHPTEKEMAKRFRISYDTFCDAVCSFRDTFQFTLPTRINPAQGATLKTNDHRKKMRRAAIRRKSK